MLALDAPLAIVDLETTGTHAAADRITEIAVLEVEGPDVVSAWSTLVNPGRPIPAEIQALTGIDAQMVARAPCFAELAEALYERLAGRVLVAHNARFDYGFLRREFDRAGLRYHARTMCTVRLSRRLYPGEPRHDLDSVISRHGIDCRARHRALGDADALLQFLRRAVDEHGEEIVSVAARQVAKHATLPPHLDQAMLDEVPEAGGVYLLFDINHLLYVGKSRNMRQRILQRFASGATWVARVQRIEWQRTAGELGALLREAELVKVLAPEFNRRLRRPRLAPPTAADWPHRGALGVVETDHAREATEVHVVDRWCYLGTAQCDADLPELLEGGRKARFDYDHYRILSRHLARPGVRVVPLSA
ncbi:MAG: exonuclease domain-containing protein [Betaproteobacteria bacterium]